MLPSYWKGLGGREGVAGVAGVVRSPRGLLRSGQEQVSQTYCERCVRVYGANWDHLNEKHSLAGDR